MTSSCQISEMPGARSSKSIYRIARDALPPDSQDLENALKQLQSLRRNIELSQIRQLFPKLLDDRGNAAAFYTLPNTAKLLAELIGDRTDFLGGSRIADFACGTGSLLREGQLHERRVRKTHRA